MANQNTTVETNTLVVTGGSPSINVITDFGATGSRGGLILYGDGKPSEAGIQFPQPPQQLYWYINLKSSDSEYLYIYQYQNRDSVNQWNKVFKIIPNTYSTNISLEFVNGVAIANIIVSNTTLPILSQSTLPQLNTHIDLQTSSGAPIASSFTLLGYDVVEENDFPVAYALRIQVQAAQFVAVPTPGVVPLSGEALAHITINVI